jgi:hypothetical protein
VAAGIRRNRELGRLKSNPSRRARRRPVDPDNADSKTDITPDRLTIQLRAFVERKTQKPRRRARKQLLPSDWSLVFDTETKTDQSQRLRFGSYQLRCGNDLQERGVFYDDNGLDSKDIKTIERVIAGERDQSPEDRIYLRTRDEFVEDVLFDKAYTLGAIIVGFNLPFDLSRLAISHSSARGRMKGGFSLKLSERRDRPRLRIKHLNSRSAFIDFSATKKEQLEQDDGEDNYHDEARVIERGYFVDVKTLSAALISDPHNLKSLSEALKVKTPKVNSDEHGREELTEEYVRYGIRDSQTTWECYQALAQHYQSFDLNEVGVHELYSEASLGKAYLRAMNVRPWMEVQGNLPSTIVGHIMSAYFGGRSEVHLRRKIAQVFYCDFLSMYPTVCTLIGLWRFVIAQGIEWNDDTTETRRFIDACGPDDLRNPHTWKKLAVLVQVLPNDDVFPVRAEYPVEGNVDGNFATIGLNRLTRDEPLWFTLADCLVSKIITGKSPKVNRAVRFSPRAIQKDLRTISIAGNEAYPIEPETDDFYQCLIELRQKVKGRLEESPTEHNRSLQSDDLAIKILANATSYGIFVELNVEDLEKPGRMLCHGWKDKPWPIVSEKFEKPGKYFHPLVGALITGAARLMLALAEHNASEEGLSWAFCDTDSLAIAKPDHLDHKTFIRKASAVCDWFKPLNPYRGQGKASILQIEEVNFRPGCKGDLTAIEPLYCLAVSAKRYVLFNKVSDQITIRKASAHGLGHLLAPYDDPAKDERESRIGVELWEEDLWRAIIRATIDGHPDQVSLDDVPGFERPACSKYAATTPALLGWFRKYNHGRSYAERVRPFNFLLSLQPKSIMQLAAEDPLTALGRRSLRREPRPAAPFHKDVLEAAKLAFDRRTSLTVPVSWLRSLGSSLVRYHLHPEAKFRGGDYDQQGFLQRRHVIAETVQPIGKEADNLEEREFVGRDDAVIEYGLSRRDRSKIIVLIKKAKAEFGLRALSTAAKVSHHQVSGAIAGKPAPDHLLITLSAAARSIREIGRIKDETEARLMKHLASRVAKEGRNKVANTLGIDSSNLTKALAGKRKLSKAVLRRGTN